ncbi:hypothetical protein EUGRSUZ_E00157 [Eucalyptus grandis]|uniref:Uncharacterized protein n=2 Tax=Eucalyptus grandis TaxID=71139 RepID=A0ACC3KQQ6_EUCGR|nr:hypothetical protein EUGRSUZ_E00157 [Eucalyptus grandis]
MHSQFTPKFIPKLASTLHSVHSNTISFKVLSSQAGDSSPQRPPAIISILRMIPDWADALKEQGMQRKRTLYNHEDWLQHRSSQRHVRHLLSSLSSRVILSLIPPVTAFTLVAVMIASYNTAVLMEWLPEFFPVLRTSSLPYQLTAPALALLLVFRTEASYSRFQEGRQIWVKKLLLEYIMAFPVALKCHVTYGSDIGQDLRNRIEGDDLAMILKSKHRPRCIIEFISQSLRLLNLEESKRNVLESNLSCFHEGISTCEQLIGIPIPLSYTRLTSRFLVLWHLTLPVILWDDCHWIVVPATFISAASLFCIEEVGVLIEEPFPMLALDELCNLVRENIQEAIRTEKAIGKHLLAKRKSPIHEQSPNGRPKHKTERRNRS